MTTGDNFLSLRTKQLISQTDLKDRFFDYLKQSNETTVKRTYNSDGTFGLSKIEISSSVDDTFTLDHGNRLCTDGDGHILDPSLCVSTTPAIDFNEDIGFPNVAAMIYYVSLVYSELPIGTQTNPRNAQVEYTGYKEFIGDSGAPSAVSDLGGSIELTITNLAPLATSRKAYVWLATPRVDSSAAIELVDIVWDGVDNKITTAGTLGQSAISTTPGHYVVLIPGPTISTAAPGSGSHYVGAITGSGSPSTPTIFNVDPQTLFEVSLSEVTNVINGYAQKIEVLNEASGPASELAQPRRRYGAASWTHNGAVYLAGGAEGAASEVNLTDSYTLSTDTWATLANMPDSAVGARAAVVGGVAYVIGGYENPNVKDLCRRYDIASDTWLANATAMTAVRAYPFMEAIGGYIYVAGGVDAAFNDTDTLYRYDVAGDSWSTLTAMPDSYSRGSSCVYKGKMYVLGGFKNDALLTTGINNDLLVYSPEADSWTALAPMPIDGQFEHHRMIVVGDVMVVLGGSNDSGGYFQENLLFYSFIANSWASAGVAPFPKTYDHAFHQIGGLAVAVAGRIRSGSSNPPGEWTVRTDLSLLQSAAGHGHLATLGVKSFRTGNGTVVLKDLPASRKSVASCVVGDTIYICGGEDGSGSSTDTLWAYHPATDTYETLTSMPTARMWHDIVYHPEEHAIYALGGSNAGSAAALGVNRYDIADDTWSTPNSTLNRALYGNAAILGDNIYMPAGVTGGVIGGIDGNGAVYNVKTRTIATFGAPKGGLSGTITLVYGDHIYAVGGDDGFNLIGSSSIATNPPGTWHNGALNINDRAYAYVAGHGQRYQAIVGGFLTNTSTVTDTILLVDMVKLTTLNLSTLTTGKALAAAEFVDGVLYVFGGTTGTLTVRVANSEADAIHSFVVKTQTAVEPTNYSQGDTARSLGFSRNDIIGAFDWHRDSEIVLIINGNRPL